MAPLRRQPAGRLALAALGVSRLAAVAGGLAGRPLSAPVLSSAPDAFLPQFYAPEMTPTQFLFISSPSEKKIVYTQLKNFKSLTGRTWALVDSGLREPAGLAFDHQRGSLYVADRGASKIFRYRVVVQETTTMGVTALSLVTDGVQLCIMQGHPVEWVAVDQSGDVFYSDTGAKTINRVPADVIEMLVEGAYQCGDISVVSEKVQMVAAEAEAQREQARSEAEREATLPTDAPGTQPVALSVYEGSMNPHVTVPGGVVSDGVRLYWTNTVGGTQGGSAVEGKVRPQLPLGSTRSQLLPFPCTALTNFSEAAYGITKSNTMVFYSTSQAGSGSVYGLLQGGHAHPFVSTLVEPRGLVWDGDNTVYVADQAGSTVFSFPVGRLMDDAPLTESVFLRGAFGLALLSHGDPAFHDRAAAAGLSEAAQTALRRLLLLIAAALTAGAANM